MFRHLGRVAIAASVAVGCLLGAGSANASTYSFTFTGVHGTGILNGLVTTGANNVATSLSGNVLDGVYSGAITALIAPNDPSYSQWAVDDVVIGTAPFFSATQSSGLLFLFGSNTIGNIYYQPNNGTYFFSVALPSNLYNPGDPGVFQLTNFALVTPLPATLPLFATGLGALGLLGWRRKRKGAVSVFQAA